MLKAVYKDGIVQGFGIQKNPSWNLDRLDQPSAILDGYFHYPSSGTNVNVYIVDTGILTTHSEFLKGGEGGETRADSVR